MAKIVYACAKFTRLKERLPQIYCWKERLGTFGVWDHQNGRQNGSPALFKSMEINYCNTILIDMCVPIQSLILFFLAARYTRGIC